MKPILGAYHFRIRGGTRVDDAFMGEIAGRIAAVARAHPNVVLVDELRRPTRSAAKPGRAEVYVVVVEPASEGMHCVSRIHYAVERNVMSWSYDDGRLRFVPHLAERMLERGGAAGDAARRAGRELYANAGLLALGARLWGRLDKGDRLWNDVMLPLSDGGVAMGLMAPSRGPAVTPEGGRITRAAYGPFQPDPPGIAVWPRQVHEPVERRHVAAFTGMTYVGAAGMGPRKARVRDLLVGVRERHPVVALAGMALLWPGARTVQRAFEARRHEFARAYEDLAAVHADPDVAALFGRRTWDRTPPLPWEERPEDVRPFVEVHLPTFSTRADAERVSRERLAAGDAGPDPDGDAAPGFRG